MTIIETMNSIEFYGIVTIIVFNRFNWILLENKMEFNRFGCKFVIYSFYTEF